MFARSHRFSFKKGSPKRVYAAKSFIVRYEKTDKQNLQCAVVVGKKVDKKAVARNNVKRRIVAILKEILPLSLNFNIVVIAKKEILLIDKNTLRKELEEAFIKIQIRS